jgi:hypothetical protein
MIDDRISSVDMYFKDSFLLFINSSCIKVLDSSFESSKEISGSSDGDMYFKYSFIIFINSSCLKVLDSSFESSKEVSGSSDFVLLIH